MAVVLDAFASYLQNMLMEMAREEVGMLLGVSGEIDRLGVKLGDLKDFLADAERRRITDQSVQGWVRELKGAMYDATDILDLCHLKAMEPSAADSIGGCFNPLLFCLRDPLHAHDIGSRIKALNQRLDGIRARANDFSFLKLETYQEQRFARARHSSDERKTDPVLDTSGVVGEKIQDDTRALVEKLTTKVEGDSSDSIVAIVGVGGIGKTTLAKKVFNDEAIQDMFDKKIWLSVTQDFSEAGLLATAIIAANGVLPEVEDRALLMQALVSAVKDKKFFLVLDDMWSDREWNHLLRAPFSYGAPGSRALVTTRDDRVARGMGASDTFIHRIDKLEPEDAWLLLKKQVVSRAKDEPDVDMLKDIGMKIISKCDGLPLAIKVMGGLLCQRRIQRGDWEKVLNHSSMWSVSEMPHELNYAVYLSYEDLSPCLKQCFLHYSLLPKNEVFIYDEIVSMWISEGFVHGNLDELEGLGGEYYKELIWRNLIEPDAMWIDEWVCNMHDVVRSFAQYVARDEALVAHSGETDIITKLKTQNLLRLSIQTEGLRSNEFDWRFVQGHITLLRVLISVGHVNSSLGDSLFTFTSLRTLHLRSGQCGALLASLYKLKHLRYLCIDKTDASRLPENIGKMKFLQHISIRECGGIVKLPDSIAKLTELRYLNLKGTCIRDIPRGFHGLTNLRRLYGFPAHSDGDWCSLEELGPLSQLSGLQLVGLENICNTSSAMKARLREKVRLTQLFLCCTSRLGEDGLIKEGEGALEEEQRRIEEVFDELCPPPCLDNLGMEHYFGCRLPKWMMSAAVVPLTSLRNLTMDDLACCTQLPDGLCRLPSLELLQINGAPAIKRVGSEFQQPHHCHKAFPRLNKMRLNGMVQWEEWEWEEQVNVQVAMPVLEVLIIHGCKLRRLPPGLASYARALKKLYINKVQHLNSVESFVAVDKLQVFQNPDLERIANLPKLEKIVIIVCPKLKALEGVPALRRLVLEDYDMETLPGYLQDVKPRHLLLDCSLELLTSMAAGESSREWERFSHIQQVKAYADDGDNQRKWYVVYTKTDPFYKFETNITFTSSEISGHKE